MDIQARQYAAIIKANIAKDEYFKDFKIMPYTFIVVNRESLTPLTWTYPYTFTDVTINLKDQKGYTHTMRNFREIGKELHHYLETKQTLPEGISATEPNDLVEWIEKWR